MSPSPPPQKKQKQKPETYPEIYYLFLYRVTLASCRTPSQPLLAIAMNRLAQKTKCPAGPGQVQPVGRMWNEHKVGGSHFGTTIFILLFNN